MQEDNKRIFESTNRNPYLDNLNPHEYSNERNENNHHNNYKNNINLTASLDNFQDININTNKNEI